MTKREYLKKVAGHLQCAPAKKREIVRQLDSHIGIALGEGRELSEVLEEMGEPHVLAAEFNENMDAGEKKKGRGRKLVLILAAVNVILGAALIFNSLEAALFFLQLVGAGLIIGLIGSALAMRRYLKV